MGHSENPRNYMAGKGLAEMNAFIAIAEQRSFAKAAVRLGLSASTLSETLRRLEERLGVRLIERTTRSVAPTEAGERLLARLRPVLEDYESALESINDFRATPSGTLRLSVAPPAADLVLAPLLARFAAQYPEIRLEITVDDALADIVAGRFDAGMRHGERLERDMIALRVSEELRQGIAASRAYFEGRGRPETPDDLRRHNCIRIRLSSGALLSWRFARKGRTFEVAVEGSLVVNDVALALRAMRDGAGLLQLPTDYFAQGIAAGELESVLSDWMPNRTDTLFLYYSSRRQMRAPLQAFLDFLRQNRKVSRDRLRPGPG
jgi:DNA-binding transcriptional LysR family regulator